MSRKEIKISAEPKRVPLKVIQTLEADPNRHWVIRRATSKRIEVWLPRHGWLLDAKGKLINEARPPRRDGDGRDWFGAFLADGRWVTTDLWGEDKVLSFFSRGGKWLKEISGETLVPTKGGDDWGSSTIGWCRCIRTGDAFVASVGQGPGRGVARLNWKGEHHVLHNRDDPWKLCYSRDLEPKGMYTFLSIPDDSRKITMTRQEDGHGPLVGFPMYETDRVHSRIPDGEEFGFWPASHNVYIVTQTTAWEPETAEHSYEGPTIAQTWFYNADGTFAGWINARRIADAAAGGAMLVVDDQQRTVTVTKTYDVSAVEQFAWSDGVIAEVNRLFPDLHLGAFVRDGNLVIAHW